MYPEIDRFSDEDDYLILAHPCPPTCRQKALTKHNILSAIRKREETGASSVEIARDLKQPVSECWALVQKLRLAGEVVLTDGRWRLAGQNEESNAASPPAAEEVPITGADTTAG